jgi:hypothetical protein
MAVYEVVQNSALMARASKNPHPLGPPLQKCQVCDFGDGPGVRISGRLNKYENSADCCNFGDILATIPFMSLYNFFIIDSCYFPG